MSDKVPNYPALREQTKSDWEDKISLLNTTDPNLHYISDQWDIPLYRGKLVLILSNNTERVSKVLKTEFEPNEQLYAHTILHDADGWQGFGIILNFWHEKVNVTHGTIAHEVSHVASMVLDDRGFIPDFKNDEARSYLTEWATDKVYETINQVKLEITTDRYYKK